jgi:hypothetical protein
MARTCPKCGMTSQNPDDELKRYCGNCQEFHDDMQYEISAEDLVEGDPFGIDAAWRFTGELETTVIEVYRASIAGIEELDKRAKAESRPVLRHHDGRWSSTMMDGSPFPPDFKPTLWELDSLSWEEHIQDLKNHAGNMGLVSLIILFEAWLKDRGKKLEELVKTLPNTPFTTSDLEEMKTARNSIVHHGGAPKFRDRGKTKEVHGRFLDYDRLRVGISESVLMELAGKLTEFVNRLAGYLAQRGLGDQLRD